MSDSVIKKVIRASAGTGKTYRLSLEYIALLLKFRKQGIHFSEILVITFTKKATAEIRERIFEHLATLTEPRESTSQLLENLRAIHDLEISADDLAYLNAVYREMLLNKSSVQISTIDAFTNSIFKTVIAPYWGLADYRIENNLDPDWLAEIYQFLLENEANLNTIISLFHRTGRKKIEDYDRFIESIVQNRWLFHLIEQTPGGDDDERPIEMIASELHRAYLDRFDLLLGKFQTYLAADGVRLPLHDILKREYHSLFIGSRKEPLVSDLGDAIKSCLAENVFLRRHQKTLLKAEPFWNGSKLLRKKEHKALVEELRSDLVLAAEQLADYLLFTELLPEEKEIRAIANLVFQKYDEIKLRERVFTHSDVTYYTFKYLYHPDLSLVEQDSVTNLFYEYLSSRSRFVMIDEFQDTSIIQFKILLPIIQEVVSGVGVKEYGGVIVVGDEKQSIYGWRGGERDLLLQMPAILNDPEMITLATSYRSEPTIIEFINALFSEPALHEKLSQQSILWPYDPVKTDKHGAAGYVQLNLRNYSQSGESDNNFSQQQDTLREIVEQVLYPLIRGEKLSLKGTAILARKNSDLAQIAEILDEFGIPYILESSSSILQHRAIKPLMYLLGYLAFNDFYDLLKFLRSDYVLLDAVQLKKVLVAYREAKDHSIAEVFEKANSVKAIEKLDRLIKKISPAKTEATEKESGAAAGLLQLTKTILEEYNVTGLFTLENDLKNIMRFLELIVDFENLTTEFPRSLKGFLVYCSEHEKDEAFKQQGLENIDAINLLTIHKCKGLEFDNVFLYWHLSARTGNESGSLRYYLDYAPDFSHLQDYALTYNFDHVLPLCRRKALSRRQQTREDIEELNNLYVAITRARKNLFIYCAYKKAGGLDALLEEIENADSSEAHELLAAALYRVLDGRSALEQQNPHNAVGSLGSLVQTSAQQKTKSARDFSFIERYLNTERASFLVADGARLVREKFLDFKETFIKKRDIDKGNVAHYYLSFIKHDTEAERQLAAARTISFYGSLMKLLELEAIFQKVDAFVGSNSLLFQPAAWPKVFTELTLFSPQGREMRLDRLMINDSSREILIIDYKTGELYEEEQVAEYIAAIESLPHVRREGFKVSGRFVVVDV
jgi:ATP-dependent exoDNAse (exonuclease V) beta subunit